MRSTFTTLHPIVSLFYFVTIFGYSMFLRNPICIGIGLLCATIYSICLNGRKTLQTSLRFLLPMMLLIIIVNPLFNHQGITILGYFKNGNAFTLEACIYGVLSAMLLVTVVQWFSCWNEIMTSEKLIYIFGRIFPAMSLVLSMALRFVPRYREQFQKTAAAQTQLGRGMSDGNWILRMRHGVRILSIMITWSLEHAVQTADSMKSRGYGLEGRSSYSPYRWQIADTVCLTAVFLIGGYTLYGVLQGCFTWACYPTFLAAFLQNYPNVAWRSWMWSFYVAYGLLAIFPIITDVGGAVCEGIRMKGDAVWNG